MASIRVRHGGRKSAPQALARKTGAEHGKHRRRHVKYDIEVRATQAGGPYRRMGSERYRNGRLGVARRGVLRPAEAGKWAY